MKTEPLISGCYYHIYNRGNNGIDLFFEKENYLYFLNQYDKYITPIADTYAWCLMRNHFHFLINIKEEHEFTSDDLIYSTVYQPKVISASKQFSHLFNSYSQAINKKYKRTGSLFEKPFERKLITSDRYLKNLIFYIHHNPVHHGFEKRILDYPWSSYNSIISNKPTKLKKNEVIGYFDDIDNFINYHNENHDLDNMQDLLIDF